jgi:hypothetical protein
MGGRSKPIELATRSLDKQGDATAFFKPMLNRYSAVKVGCGVSISTKFFGRRFELSTRALPDSIS